jgi:hypothetical protein
MSVRISGRVWAHGPRERNARFVLLAIADFASDDGVAWPYVATIAERCVMTPRNVLRALKMLAKDGWISIEANPKNYKANAYQINLGKLSDDKLSDEELSRDKTGASHVTNRTVSCDKSDKPPHPLLGVTVKNRQEPPGTELESFLAAWNETCGSLPKIIGLSGGRREKLKTRIAEGLTLDTFRHLVMTCAQTPFLRGENDRKWNADFDWLVKNGEHWRRVQEAKYGKPDSASRQTYRDPAALYAGPEYASGRGPA